MATFVLPFEKPIADLMSHVRTLRKVAHPDAKLQGELRKLEEKAVHLAREIFSELSPWQKVQLSRHPSRPYTLDYIGKLFEDFTELAGDRAYAEDAAIIAGLARFRGKNVVVVGHQKGRGVKENLKRNFGMPHPEGYRKAKRMYDMAHQFRMPIITFVDTPGAYPGIGAEERGQSEAIGACLASMSRAEVPIVTTIVGEGGSGGALALAVANRVHVLEYGTYSVITPEGCASILWKDGAKAEEAASKLCITAPDLKRLGVVDLVVDEPAGGAHHDLARAASYVGDAIEEALASLAPLSGTELVQHRYARFRALGVHAS